ncbi:MAG: hypothetical protein JW754_01255 [Candidatus Aenigmarchaeota archaeon]|nr:hypothetical protein [Candidatus Aenigmarchaeota archaeon]
MMKEFLIASLLVLTVVALSGVQAQAAKDVCAVYFTYVGCPHCAVSDPLVLSEMTGKYDNLVVIEYEFVLNPENSYVIYDYNSEYQCGAGVPMIIFDKSKMIVGDTPIVESVDGVIASGPNECPLLEGQVDFSSVDINGLPGSPKLWTKDRILIRKGETGDNSVLMGLLKSSDIQSVLEGVEYEITDPEPVQLSGIKFPQLGVPGTVEFEHAIIVDGWEFQWNGEGIEEGKCPGCPGPGEWSDCVGGRRTRINYECSGNTGYVCVQYTEEVDCVEGCPACRDPSEWSECVNNERTRTNYMCSEETGFECLAYEETGECEESGGNSVNPDSGMAVFAVPAVVIVIIFFAVISYLKLIRGGL